jgi:hypothetical protein
MSSETVLTLRASPQDLTSSEEAASFRRSRRHGRHVRAYRLRRHTDVGRSFHEHLAEHIDRAAVPDDRRTEDPLRRERARGRSRAPVEPLAGEPSRLRPDVGPPRRARASGGRRPARLRAFRASRLALGAARDGGVRRSGSPTSSGSSTRTRSARTSAPAPCCSRLPTTPAAASIVVGSGGASYPLELGGILNDWVVAPDVEGYRAADPREIVSAAVSGIERYELPDSCQRGLPLRL